MLKVKKKQKVNQSPNNNVKAKSIPKEKCIWITENKWVALKAEAEKTAASDQHESMGKSS